MSRYTTLRYLVFIICSIGLKFDGLKSYGQQGPLEFQSAYDSTFSRSDASDFAGALIYAQAAQQIARAQSDSMLIVKSGRVKGQVLRRMNELEKSTQELKTVLPVARRNKYYIEAGTILNAIGLNYTFGAKFDQALAAFFEAREIVPKEESDLRAAILNNIGLTYYKIGAYEKAKQFYKDAVTTGLQGDRLAICLVNIGLCFNSLNRYDSSKVFFERGLLSCGNDCGTSTTLQAEYGMAVVAFSAQKMDEAETRFTNSYQLAVGDNDLRFQLDNLIYLSRIARTKGEFRRSIELMNRAEAIASGSAFAGERMKIYFELSRAFADAKSPAKSNRYQAHYIDILDSVFSEQMRTNLMTVQAEYDQRDLKTRVASQAVILDLKEEIIDKQGITNILIGIVAIFFVALSLIFYKVGLQRRRLNVYLDKKVVERTVALEESLAEIKRRHSEQDLLLGRMAGDMKACVATIRGLSGLARDIRGGLEAAERYEKELNGAASRLDDLVDRIRKKSD